MFSEICVLVILSTGGQQHPPPQVGTHPIPYPGQVDRDLPCPTLPLDAPEAEPARLQRSVSKVIEGIGLGVVVGKPHIVNVRSFLFTGLLDLA